MRTLVAADAIQNLLPRIFNPTPAFYADPFPFFQISVMLEKVGMMISTSTGSPSSDSVCGM
jgi:hypothetical protein